MTIYDISEKLNISVKDLHEILFSISNEKVSTAVLLQKTGFSKETLKKFREVCSEYLEPIPTAFILNEKGKALLKSFEKFKRTITLEDEKAIRDFFEENKDRFPVAKREFDQFYSTIETKLKRLQKLLEDNFLENLSILFIGDDDFISIALSLLKIPMRICVIDVDVRLLDFINEASRRLKLNIETTNYNIIKDFPKELSKSFDIVFSDPPYTPSGFNIFLNRELEASKGFSTIYICYGTSERSSERILPIQKAINDLGLEIKEVHYKFNSYEGAESIGSSSNLYVLKPTAMTRYEKKLDIKRIYTYE